MPVAASDAVTALTAAFTDRGPRNPKIAFRADGDNILVTITTTERGEITHVAEQELPGPPSAATPGRLRSFAHGTAMAAHQLASRGSPESLSPDEVYCPELLGVPELATAEAFRRAILDEQGLRGALRGQRAAAELAAEIGMPVPDAEGLALLLPLVDPESDRSFADRCDALRGIVGSRQDLLPFLIPIVESWVEEPDATWPGGDEADTEHPGPVLLAGLLKALLPGLPATARAPLAQALDRMPPVPSADDLRALGLL